MALKKRGKLGRKIDMLDRERLLAETWVREICQFDELESTNSDALERGKTDITTPLLIWALQQTAGRGRGNNSWWAAPGSLTFTLLIEPEQWGIPRERWPGLSLCVGTAVCHALQRMQVREVGLKWPNDVYVDSRKICGILIESVPTRPDRLAIGIGLNVNNSFAKAPPELQTSATSLIDVLQVESCLPDVLILVLQELEQIFRIAGTRPAELPPLWQTLCWLTDRVVTITDVRGTTTGTVLSIATDGALRLMTARGEQRVVSGTVTVQDNDPVHFPQG